MMKKSLKMAIELAGWGAYGLRNESLSGVDWLGGCGGNWGNDVPNSKKTLHYYNRLGSTRALRAQNFDLHLFTHSLPYLGQSIF